MNVFGQQSQAGIRFAIAMVDGLREIEIDRYELHAYGPKLQLGMRFNQYGGWAIIQMKRIRCQGLPQANSARSDA